MCADLIAGLSLTTTSYFLGWAKCVKLFLDLREINSPEKVPLCCLSWRAKSRKIIGNFSCQRGAQVRIFPWKTAQFKHVIAESRKAKVTSSLMSIPIAFILRRLSPLLRKGLPRQQRSKSLYLSKQWRESVMNNSPLRRDGAKSYLLCHLLFWWVFLCKLLGIVWARCQPVWMLAAVYSFSAAFNRLSSSWCKALWSGLSLRIVMICR
jgi:hypothetical protein